MNALPTPAVLADAQALAYVQTAAQVAGIPMPADRAQRVAFQLVQISRMAASLHALDMPEALELAEIYRLPRADEQAGKDRDAGTDAGTDAGAPS